MPTPRAGLLLILLGIGTLFVATDRLKRTTRSASVIWKPPAEVVGPSWVPGESEAVLPSGAVVHFTCHFDRNALRAALDTSAGIVALTESGNLLRFDRETLRLDGERPLSSAGFGLFDCEDAGLLVSCMDGSLLRLDPGTLALTEVARLPGPAVWVGSYHDPAQHQTGLLAVLWNEPRGNVGWRFTLCRIGFGPMTATTYSPPGLADSAPVSGFLLDWRQRLWLGTDAGEWGGWCCYVDLTDGELVSVDQSDGVAGFIELVDGRVWAFGGMTHLFTRRGFIARLDRGRFEPIASFPGKWGRGVRRPGGPRAAITHILPAPEGRGLLVFAGFDRFRVDSELTRWEYLGTSSLLAIPSGSWIGRPYPAVRSILSPDSAGNLVAVTAHHGLARIKGANMMRFPVGGQLGEDSLSVLSSLPDGVVVAGEYAWRRAAGGWERLPSSPPTPAPPERPLPEIGKIHAALPLDDATVLLATEAGLRVWEPATDKLRRPTFPVPPGEVTALCSDRAGRLWLGGTGLWVLDRELHSLEVTPMPRGDGRGAGAGRGTRRGLGVDREARRDIRPAHAEAVNVIEAGALGERR